MIGLTEGGAKCSSACPFYEESGEVQGFGGSMRTHCRMTMHPWMADCDIYNPNTIVTLEVTKEQWAKMQEAVNKKAKRQRKLYPENHETNHAPGCEWTRSKGLHNAAKSGKVIIRHYNKIQEP